MRRLLSNRRCPAVAALMQTAMLAVAGCADIRAATAPQQRQVLTLYSTRRDAEVVTIGERELPRILAEGLSGHLDYYSEFIDQSRIGNASLNVFREYLTQKYARHRFDLLIAMDAGALEFVYRNRSELFPSAPVVFFSSRPSPPRPVSATGINAVINLRDTVALAAALQPDLRNIFVVTGADRSYEMLARAELQRYAATFSITYLAALETSRLEARLASLPPGSMVYYIHVTRDGANVNFNALEYLDRIVAVANAPTYSWADSTMGHGVVGGSLRSLTAQMNEVGRLALRVLSGEPADDIPVQQPDLNVSQVDWRQLRRWGIPDWRVPVGTRITFREPSAWEQYRVYVVLGTAALIAQAALIAGLLIQRNRRRQAEERAVQSQAALVVSYERIRDLGAKLLEAQEAERARIARELNDDVGEQLVLLTIELSKVHAGGALECTQALARTIHDISHRLHPDKLQLLGLPAAIRALERELTSSATKVVFTEENVPRDLPDNVVIGLYRVAQEAVQNALKHGHASQIHVQLRGDNKLLTLTIKDDGVGFHVDQAWGDGLGLASMRERVQAMRGIFEVRSESGAGTEVLVSVPCDGETATLSFHET